MGIYYYVCRSNFAIQVTNHVIQYGFDIAKLVYVVCKNKYL